MSKTSVEAVERPVELKIITNLNSNCFTLSVLAFQMSRLTVKFKMNYSKMMLLDYLRGISIIYALLMSATVIIFWSITFYMLIFIYLSIFFVSISMSSKVCFYELCNYVQVCLRKIQMRFLEPFSEKNTGNLDVQLVSIDVMQ